MTTSNWRAPPVDDRAFGEELVASFERDLSEARRIDLAAVHARTVFERVLAWVAARFRGLL